MMGTGTSTSSTQTVALRAGSQWKRAIKMLLRGHATDGGSISRRMTGAVATSGECLQTGGPAQRITSGGSGYMARESSDGKSW